MQRIGVLGSGNVGTVLANGFLKHGYAVVRGSREPAKLGDWLEQAGPNARTGTFADAARAAEIVVLAVKGEAAEAVLLEHAERIRAEEVVVGDAGLRAGDPPAHEPAQRAGLVEPHLGRLLPERLRAGGRRAAVDGAHGRGGRPGVEPLS